jgi:hypothetical protein
MAWPLPRLTAPVPTPSRPTGIRVTIALHLYVQMSQPFSVSQIYTNLVPGLLHSPPAGRAGDGGAGAAVGDGMVDATPIDKCLLASAVKEANAALEAAAPMYVPSRPPL